MATIVFTRPAAWEGLPSKHKLVHVPIGGRDPRRNSGKPAGDGIGVVALPERVDELEQVLAKHRPEFYVLAQHQHFGAEQMARCRMASPDTLWCYMEGNQPGGVSGVVGRLAQFIDVVMINNWHEPTIRAYNAIGKVVVPGFWDGYDPADHVRESVMAAEFQCFFGGSNLRCADDHGFNGWQFPNGKGRALFIARVAGQFTTLLDGPVREWMRYTAGTKATVNGVRAHADYLHDMQRARLLLGYNHIDLTRYYTRRTIHSAASGRLLVTRYIPGMECDFDLDCTIAAFKTDAEGVEMVRWFLDHPGEREARAERTQRVMLTNHTWEARLRRFESIAPALLDRRAECVC